MDAEELKSRTKIMAGKIIRFVESLSRDAASEVIGKQLIRSATSVAANYRSVCRARSRPDFVNKVSIVLEEADETLFWLEMLVEAGKVNADHVSPLHKEVEELTRIFAASRATAKRNVTIFKSSNRQS